MSDNARFGFVNFAETWNGRLAMLGIVIGLGTELLTGQGILSQIGLGCFPLRGFTKPLGSPGGFLLPLQQPPLMQHSGEDSTETVVGTALRSEQT